MAGAAGPLLTIVIPRQAGIHWTFGKKANRTQKAKLLGSHLRGNDERGSIFVMSFIAMRQNKTQSPWHPVRQRQANPITLADVNQVTQSLTEAGRAPSR